MNRSFRAATAAILAAAGLGSVGCYHRTGVTVEDRYRNAVDVSWPDRYNYAARQAVLAPFAQQAANGHFTNQTIWNWYFDPGTDRLNPAGVAKLDSLAQVTPGPDPKINIQAARDVLVTPENIDRVSALRDELTARRAAAIQRYMATQPGPTVVYEYAVVDMPTPGIYSLFPATSFRGQFMGYRGGLTGAAGTQTGINSGTNLLLGTGAPTGAAGQGTPAGSSPPASTGGGAGPGF